MTQHSNKMGNIKTQDPDGTWFDSRLEAKRYTDLKIMLAAGQIRSLEVHPKFDLIPTIRFRDRLRKKTITLRKTTYSADFRYEEKCVYPPVLYPSETGAKPVPKADSSDLSWRLVVEDVKGHKTDVFKLKERLFRQLYPDVDFRILMTEDV